MEKHDPTSNLPTYDEWRALQRCKMKLLGEGTYDAVGDAALIESFVKRFCDPVTGHMRLRDLHGNKSD